MHGKSFDMLGSVRNVQTPLMLTLVGFRKSISKHLGLKAFPQIMHDNQKAVVRREQHDSYPYGWFRISSFEIQRDMQPNKTLRRHGSTMTLDDLTNATVSKGYLFPTLLNVEMRYINNDPIETLMLIEKVAVLGAVDGFSFKVNMPGAPEWTVGVQLSEGPVDVPQSELENEADAAAFDLSLNFTIRTRVGVIKSVPKINNEGRVTQSIGVAP